MKRILALLVVGFLVMVQPILAQDIQAFCDGNSGLVWGRDGLPLPQEEPCLPLRLYDAVQFWSGTQAGENFGVNGKIKGLTWSEIKDVAQGYSGGSVWMVGYDVKGQQQPAYRTQMVDGLSCDKLKLGSNLMVSLTQRNATIRVRNARQIADTTLTGEKLLSETRFAAASDAVLKNGVCWVQMPTIDESTKWLVANDGQSWLVIPDPFFVGEMAIDVIGGKLPELNLSSNALVFFVEPWHSGKSGQVSNVGLSVALLWSQLADFIKLGSKDFPDPDGDVSTVAWPNGSIRIPICHEGTVNTVVNLQGLSSANQWSVVTTLAQWQKVCVVGIKDSLYAVKTEDTPASPWGWLQTLFVQLTDTSITLPNIAAYLLPPLTSESTAEPVIEVTAEPESSG